MAVDNYRSLRVPIVYYLRWLSNVFQYTYTLQISITLHKFAGLRCLEEIFLHWRSPLPTTACNIHQSGSSVYHNGRKFFKCKFIVLISVSHVSHRTCLLHRHLHAWEMILRFFSYYTNRTTKQNEHCKQSSVSQSFHSLLRYVQPLCFFRDFSNYYSTFPDK